MMVRVACVPVRIGRGHDVRVRRAAFAAFPVEFVRTDVNERRQMTMIGVPNRRYMPKTRVGPRNAQRQIVGLAPAVYEKTYGQRIGEPGRQAFRIGAQFVVEVARVRIQYAQPPRYGLRHAGMPMPYMRHVVHRVEKRLPVPVVQKGPMPPVYAQGRPVRNAQRRRNAFPAARQRFRRIRRPGRARGGGKPQQVGRIGRNGHPYIPAPRRRHPRESPFDMHPVRYDLHMRVRRPAPVLVRRPDLCDFFPGPHGRANLQPPNRGAGQVAVQRTERRTAFGSVFKQYGRAVITGRVVICHAANHAIERRENRAARRLEQIDAQMDRAHFGTRLVLRPPIRQAHFGIPANARLRARLLHPALYFARRPIRIRKIPEYPARTLRTEIERFHRSSGRGHDRRKRSLAATAPGDGAGAVRARLVPAGLPNRIFRKTRGDVAQQRQRAKRRFPADRKIGVVRLHALLLRGHAHANAEPHGQKGKQDGRFALVERKNLVATSCHGDGGAKRIGHAQYAVRRSHRQVGHRIGNEHVSKVD